MLGSIIGDIIGSQYEVIQYKGGKKFIPEQLIDDKSHFTDDTVCSLAIADSILNSKSFDTNLQAWARKYDTGYGGYFKEWLKLSVPKPYNSYGNGSAMRISAIPYLANSMAECKDLAKQATEITHDHFESFKAVECVTSLMYHILNDNFTMIECIQFVKDYYPEIQNFNLGDLHKNYKFKVTASESVPHAIFCFIKSNDYVSTIKNCLFIGGDVDTIAAIAGGIAEAYYKEIPKDLIDKAYPKLTGTMKELLNQFNYYKDLDVYFDEKNCNRLIFKSGKNSKALLIPPRKNSIDIYNPYNEDLTNYTLGTGAYVIITNFKDRKVYRNGSLICETKLTY